MFWHVTVGLGQSKCGLYTQKTRKFSCVWRKISHTNKTNKSKNFNKQNHQQRAVRGHMTRKLTLHTSHDAHTAAGTTGALWIVTWLGCHCVSTLFTKQRGTCEFSHLFWNSGVLNIINNLSRHCQTFMLFFHSPIPSPSLQPSPSVYFKTN